MLKKLLVLGSVLLAGIGLATSSVCYAKEEVVLLEETTPETVETVEYPCKVVENVSDGGNVLCDITEGNVGDKVTVLVKPEFLFSVESITINGNKVEITKEGKYEFELVEGENIITVKFVVNNEKLTEIAELISNVRNNGFSSLFTVSNLLNLISWVISVLLSSGFFITLIKNKRLRARTIEEVQTAVTDVVDKKVSEAILNFLKEILGPTLNTITDKVDGTNECIKVFCRCFVLAQDDTPENRLAIINELTKLNNNDEALTNQIRAIIKEEQKAQEERIIARDKAIEELKKNNENLVKNDEEQVDNYGQF